MIESYSGSSDDLFHSLLPKLTAITLNTLAIAITIASITRFFHLFRYTNIIIDFIAEKKFLLQIIRFLSQKPFILQETPLTRLTFQFPLQQVSL